MPHNGTSHPPAPANSTPAPDPAVPPAQSASPSSAPPAKQLTTQQIAQISRGYDPAMEMPLVDGIGTDLDEKDLAGDIFGRVLKGANKPSQTLSERLYDIPMEVYLVQGPGPLSPEGRLAKMNQTSGQPITECYRVWGKTPFDTSVTRPKNLLNPGDELNNVFEGVYVEIAVNDPRGTPPIGAKILINHPFAWNWRSSCGTISSTNVTENGGMVMSMPNNIRGKYSFQPKTRAEYVARYAKKEALSEEYPNLQFAKTVNIQDAAPETVEWLKLFNDAASGGPKPKINSMYRSPLNQANIVFRNFNSHGGATGGGSEYIRKLYSKYGTRVEELITLMSIPADQISNGEPGRLGTLGEFWDSVPKGGGHMSGRSIDIGFVGGPLKILGIIRKAAKQSGNSTSVLIEKDHFHIASPKSGTTVYSERIFGRVLKGPNGFYSNPGGDFAWLKNIPPLPEGLKGTSIARKRILAWKAAPKVPIA